MKVYELNLKVFLLKNIAIEDSHEKIAEFIDLALGKNEDFLKLHRENEFKNYCFNSFYPLEEDGIYKAGKIYTVNLRTINMELAKYFNDTLANEYNNVIKGLVSEIKILPKRPIDKLYSITPVILKTDKGYWKNSMNIDDFEKRVKENLIKKYNHFNKVKVDEDFELYTTIMVKNKKPIATAYKGRRILGDKVNMIISTEEISQELAYMALGTGIGEMNARGLGFVNFKWI